MSIKKAIIPAADLGTRFLPAIKAMPVDKPIQGTPPSNYAIVERYILTPEIFRSLDE